MLFCSCPRQTAAIANPDPRGRQVWGGEGARYGEGISRGRGGEGRRNTGGPSAGPAEDSGKLATGSGDEHQEKSVSSADDWRSAQEMRLRDGAYLRVS